MRSFPLCSRWPAAWALMLWVYVAALSAEPSWAQTRPPLKEPVPPVAPIEAGVAVLIVDPPSGGNVMDSDALLQRRINTHAATIGSEQHLRKVIAQPEGETRKTRWFKESDNPLERAQWLRDHLHVMPLPGTSLIQVSLPDLADAGERRTIVQAICQSYIEGQRSQRSDELLDRTMTLNNSRVKAEAQLKILRADMREKAVRMNLDGAAVGGIGNSLGTKDIELSRLVQEHVNAQLALGKAAAQLKTIADLLHEGQSPDGTDEMMLRLDSTLQQEATQLQQMEIERELLADQNGADNVKLKMASQRVEKMRAAHEKRVEETRIKARNAILEHAQQEAANSEAKVKGLAVRVDNLKQDMAELSNSLIQYATLQREEQGLTEQLRQVKQQIDSIMAMQSSKALGEIRWHLYPEVTPVQ